jgi:hypothetical protein
LLRIKGELLLKNTNPPRLGDCPAGDRNKLSAILEAQACFSEAVGIAKQQKTRSWELRAYMSMDQLNTLQGKPDHTHLSKSYASFTEGYETADLKQARTLLSAALPS